MEKVSVVHYAGHLPDMEGSHFYGWQLGSGHIFDISDMESLTNCHSIPWLIFSNSCHAGNCNNGYGLSGIAGTFLKAGVLQVMCPFGKLE